MANGSWARSPSHIETGQEKKTFDNGKVAEWISSSLWVQFLSFLYSFWEQFDQIMGWHPHLEGWRPPLSPSGKSWIRHWYYLIVVWSCWYTVDWTRYSIVDLWTESLCLSRNSGMHWSNWGDIMSNSLFCLLFFNFWGATDASVLNFWWLLFWVSKPRWIPCMLSCLCDPQIHLWCNTCWLYRNQHGSQVFSIHILTDMSANIVGGSGQTGNEDRLCSKQQAMISDSCLNLLRE